MKYINLFDNFQPISENLKYHVDNNLPVLENIFRPGSKSFFEMIKEARDLFDNGKVELSGIDKILFESTDLFKKMKELLYPMMGQNTSYIMEYEVRYGSKLIFESEDKLRTEQLISESWDFVKSKIYDQTIVIFHWVSFF